MKGKNMDYSCWVLIGAFLCVAGGVIYVAFKERKKHKQETESKLADF
jgi:hypothetical protein